MQQSHSLCALADQFRDEGNYIQAFALYKQSAEEGYHWAQYHLGALYQFGNGVQQNLEEAVNWYQKAANQGNDNAKKAIQGCAEELCGVADHYRNQEDYAKALILYQQSAEVGYHWSQVNLGHFYRYGHVVDKSLETAMCWYQKAAVQGNAHAINAIKECTEGLCEIADQYAKPHHYRKAMELRDQSVAMGYYCSLMDNPIPSSPYPIAYFYRHIPPVSNMIVAIHLYELAAKWGSDRAQVSLGDCSKNYNLEKSIGWYREAASQGNATAIDKVKEYEKLSETCRDADNYRDNGDYTKALELYIKSAEGGYHWAQYHLGALYQYGNGVDKDLGKAVQWYGKAASQGNINATSNLSECKQLMQNSEKATYIPRPFI